MLIPRYVRGQMIHAESAPFAIQHTLQTGCNDGCGWSGDPFLIVRELPAKRGNGWAVLTNEHEKPVIFYRRDQQQPSDPYAIDHRVVDYLNDARRNWQLDNTLQQMDAHDAKLEKEQDAKEFEMRIELSKQVRHALKKDGQI